MELKTVYFEKPGKQNTNEVIRIVKNRVKELGIKKVIVASTTGDTAAKAVNALKGLNVIIVTHSVGIKELNTQEFTEANRKKVTAGGGIILTATHAFGGISRSMHQGLSPEMRQTYVIGDVVANTLRIFGQGMKVACEIAVMAADAGLVRTDEDVISIAGTGSPEAGRGSDVAILLKPANSHLFFEMRVKEILCKPHF